MIVDFDPSDFKRAYPEFENISDDRLSVLFDLAASALLDNVDNRPSMPFDKRKALFYLLVAHLSALFGTAGGSGQTSNRPPGRLSSASEGSISTGFEYAVPQGSALAAWFNQTPYGALYWTAIAPYRSLKYFAYGASGVGRAVNYLSPRFRPWAQ